MFTYHDDNMRTGQNLNETVLTPANVNSSSFGKLFSLPLDGDRVRLAALRRERLRPGQGTHNVVYVATEHDSVYAYDADGRIDDAAVEGQLHRSGQRRHDRAGGRHRRMLRHRARDRDHEHPRHRQEHEHASTSSRRRRRSSGGTTNYVQRLHALDITTGAEKPGGPVVIQATVPGTGAGSSDGQLPFDPLRENQRTGLLLLNGVVYFGFSSHGDDQPYHGWIFGYNASTLQQTLAFCLTPNQEGAGVWMSGGGIAADATGALYYDHRGRRVRRQHGRVGAGATRYHQDDHRRCRLRLLHAVQPEPLNPGNHDLGSGDALLLPDQPGAHPHVMVSSGKDGSIYLVDRDNMGHYNSSTNNIVQTLPNIFPNGSPEPGNFSTPVYYNGYVFFGPLADNLQAFKLTNGLLSTTPTFRSAASSPTAAPPWRSLRTGRPTGSSGRCSGTVTTSPGVLYAYDPTNSSGGMLKELYDSAQAGSRDTLDSRRSSTSR